MDNENETTIEDTDELEDLDLGDDTADTDTTDWKAEAEKARGIAKRLQTKLEKSKKTETKEEPKTEPVKKEAKPEGLDDVESLLLEVKGIQDPDDVALYEKWKSDTSRPPRDILNNSIFQKELEAQRADRAVKDATPSGTKRAGGGSGNDLASDLAKFERTNELPDDFDRRSAVVNALAARDSGSTPRWRQY